jgi:guanylate kinase
VSSSHGKLYVVSSPSGGGKSTIIRHLLKEDPSLRYSVSATTREPRNGENDCVDYIFMNLKAFEEKIRQNAFLEWASIYGYYYGTLKDPVFGWISEGRKILLDLDVQGAEAVKRNRPESILIFLMPPSIAVLKERLLRRGTDSTEVIELRLHAAEEEMKMVDRYDFLVFNDRLRETVRTVETIIHKNN